MDRKYLVLYFVIIVAGLSLFLSPGYSQEVQLLPGNQGLKVFSLKNEKLTLKVVADSNGILSDSLTGEPGWITRNGGTPFTLASDAGFGLEFVWTDWQAPHASENAENPVILGKQDFGIDNVLVTRFPAGGGEIVFHLKGADFPMIAVLTYRLDPEAFYIKRKISVSDTVFGHHYLTSIMAARSEYCAVAAGPDGKTMKIPPSVLHKGSFGQPVAIVFPGHGSTFLGLEYPASANTENISTGGTFTASCSQEFGVKVGRDPIESEWAVEAFIPGVNAKQWFFRYLDDIRVAPARPYTLYNSWYDLRSPEYPKVAPGNIMNEANVFNIISLFKKNMLDKHHIRLDAFVLDDGWDVYESDWVLRKETFPNGLKPISDTLKKMGTSLGIWFGPTGGYSFRMKRVNWMKSHGYEVVGESRDNAMLCLAGKNYSDLFQKRVTDMVSKDGMGYFKWDGIQFSCSEPDHGHAVGIYSRRAILESLIDKCKAVRAIDPHVYLNITSGTWLSPWWVKYANQIWMQGEDYGYADVPSISQRDAAITYKDFVLYDDLVAKDWWFPVSNLMTHGIIKGNLERLGGEDDPLDKFTNDAVFYLARGISMYELYISPDLLNDGEWNAIGSAINWARDRYDILASTNMVGGNPMNREAYGYLHFNGKRGILAVRNPSISPAAMSVWLSEEYGIDPSAKNLVVEQVYPYRYISNQLTQAGASLEISLDGFETAVYEIYPLEDAKEPLLAGARFDVNAVSGYRYDLSVYDGSENIVFLNPDKIKESNRGGIDDMITWDESKKNVPAVKSHTAPLFRPGKEVNTLETMLECDPSMKDATFAVLLKPAKESEKAPFPVFTFRVNGKEVKVAQELEKGQWIWYKVPIGPDAKKVVAMIKKDRKSGSWKGKASVYLICRQKENPTQYVLTAREPVNARPTPPRPFENGVFQKTTLLGDEDIVVK
jgi:hypothetical protein